MSSIDVVVPCYRYGQFLRGCVQSVLSQSVQDVRILILDDASPDDTPEVGKALAQEDNRVTYLRHATNQGHIPTFNEGIEWVSADYYLLLSADDYLLPGALQRAMSVMDEHPEVGFTYGKALELNQDNPDDAPPQIQETAQASMTRIYSGSEFIDAMGSRNFVHTPTAIIRTRLQKQVGGYNPKLRHTGDMEMWLRLAAQASVASIGAYQAVYRRHASNMSSHYFQNYCLPDLEQRLAAIDSFFESDGRHIRHAQQMHEKMRRMLGREAIGFASTAFNDDEMEMSQQLSAFALSIAPDLKTSLPWTKLVCKRSLGLRGWRLVQAVRSAWTTR